MTCEPAGSFACFVDADWTQFWIDLSASGATVLAVGIAVFEVIRSSRRANKADKRAAFATAEATARAEIERRRARSSTEAERLRLESDIAIQEQFLRVAQDYDPLRVGAIEANLAELRLKLDAIKDAARG